MNLTLDFGNHLRYADDVLDGGDHNSDIDPNTHTDLEEGTYEAGRLLRTRYTRSDGKSENNFDTGLVNADFRESSIVFVDQFTDSTKVTHDKTFLYVYDIYGRMWEFKVTDKDTVHSFNDGILTVNTPSLYKPASKESEKIIAVRKSSGDIEFMSYNSINTADLTIAKRKLFSGIGYKFNTSDEIFVLSGTLIHIDKSDGRQYTQQGYSTYGYSAP